MEFSLSNSPVHGYQPGDTLSGEVKYNIASPQENIIDVRIHLDGSVLVHPSKLKYEAQRSNITLVEESRTPFKGPFTLKRQLLVWPFAFVLPETVLVRDVSVPLPPSMDHRFREGIQIRVEYNITATIRIGSGHKSAKQASHVVLVKQPANPTALESPTFALSFPLMYVRTDGMKQRLLSRLKSSSSKTNTDPVATQLSVQLEMTLPLALSIDQRDAITCSLTEFTVTSGSSNNTTFVLEIAEFALRRRLMWQDLEDVKHIGTATMRPGMELNVDGQIFTLPGTLGLQDFMKSREIPDSLTSYNSVIPEVSLELTMTVTVVLKHKISGGRHIHTTATLPIVIVDSNAERTVPPTYENLETTPIAIPPPYEDASHQ